MLSLLIPKTVVVFAAFNTGQACNPNTGGHAFFGFPHWWKYVKQGEQDGLGHCMPKVNFPSGIWSIVLAGIDMLLYLGGIVAVVSIIIAGITYITSSGNADRAAAARKRIINSLIGLAIVLGASAFVAFIGSQVGK